MENLILIVDDMEANRYFWSRTLKAAGHQVIEAASVDEARRQLSKNPKLILLDIRLPDGNGYEFCQELKSISTAAVILTSANFTQSSDHLRAIDSGENAYLVSPIDPLILLGTVKSWMKVKTIERQKDLAEGRLALALSTSGIGFWEYSPTHKTLFLSDRFKEIWHQPNDWQGNPDDLLATLFPQDRKKIIKLLDALLVSEISFELEFQITAFDGSEKWIQTKVAMLKPDGGSRGKLNGTVVDITAHKKMSASIIESELQFRTLAESMPLVVWTAKPDGYIDWYNRGWFDLTGAEPGQSWEPFIHPEDLEPTSERWRRSFTTGEPYVAEYRFMSKDTGLYRWYLGRAVPIRDLEGHITKWIGTNTDIHEKMEIEKILENQAKVSQKITEAIPQGIWITDLDGSATYFSQRFSELVGYSVEELLGWGWYEIIHPADKGPVAVEWQRCRNNFESVSFEFRIRHNSGQYMWVLSRGTPFKEDTGDYTKYYGTWTNIDDLKQTQDKLSAAINARDEFLSIASHELKTPLTSLKLSSQLFFRQVEKRGDEAYAKDKVDELVRQAEKQTNRLNRLVDDMLDISRIRTGKLSTTKSSSELAALVREVTERLHHHLSSEVEILFDSNLSVPAFVDALRIEQVLTNLLTNADRYGQGQKISVDLKVEDGIARISVEDHGMGIEQKNLSIIFDRFERAVSANEVSGLGLGLYISKQILLAHGGDIEVKSSLGEGSTFTALIPLRA
jgi:PAS domain S-box-containing protein